MSRAELAVTAPEAHIVHGVLHSLLAGKIRVWVFGSRANGTARRSSDLDLAIDAGRALSLEEIDRLRMAFTESPLPYTVDIVDLRSVESGFAALIEKQRVPLPDPG